jgi:hypothetical protein
MADSANGAREVGRSRAFEQIMSRQEAKTQSAKREESGVRIQEVLGRSVTRLEGSRFGACLKVWCYSFQCEEGQIWCQTGGSRELPHAMFCPRVFHSETVHRLNGPIDPTLVETFAGAACLTKFAVMDAPRQISRGVWVRSKAAHLQAVSLQVPRPPGSWILLLTPF